jgi:peptidoglycan/LPS O-acetylase OafA/YrhL
MKHDTRLQSLRGLAALSVALCHAGEVLPTTPLWFKVIFQGEGPVIFFYVLSGYVLSQSLRRNSNLVSFVKRRILRLAPAYVVSILVAAGVLLVIRNGVHVNALPWWNNSVYGGDLSWHGLMNNIFWMPTDINGPLWSVKVEFVAIIFLPALVWFSSKMNQAVVLLALAVLTILSWTVLLPRGFVDDAWRMPAYVFCFWLGALVPRMTETTISSFVMAIAGYFVLHIAHDRGFIDPATVSVGDALVATYIIAYLHNHPKSFTSLNFRPLVWLGDTSYSFYVYAQTIMLLVMWLLFQYLGPPFDFTFTLAGIGFMLVVTLPLAALSYRFIEQPFIALGAHSTGILSAILPASLLGGPPGPQHPQRPPYWAAAELTDTMADSRRENWELILEPYRSRIKSVLEVGSFEGQSALFWLNYFNKPKVTCVDIWDSPEIEARFDRNIRSRARKIKSPSNLGLHYLSDERFDLIYIDGDHSRFQVMADTCLAWRLLRRGGIMIWDDYEDYMKGEIDRPTPAIDASIKTMNDEIDWTRSTGNQLFARKR